MKLICGAVVLVLLVSLCSAARCPAGQFWYQPRPWFQGECQYCSRGWYCPGNDNAFQCEGNSITDDWGMTKCVLCPADLPYASPWKTFCMPPDVPKDAQTVFLESFGAEERITFTTKSRHLIMEIAFEEYTQIASLTFYNSSSSSYPFGMYLSTKSGNPSEDNYEMKAFGQNVTFAFNKPQKSYFIPVYITLDTPGDLHLFVTVEGSYKDIVMLDDAKEVAFQMEAHSFTLQNPYVFFQVPNIQQRSRVNITFSLEVDNAGVLITDIYTAPNTELQFPNEHNYKIRAHDYARDMSTVSSSLVLDDVFPGTLYFAGSTTIFVKTSSLRIKAKVVITPKQ